MKITFQVTFHMFCYDLGVIFSFQWKVKKKKKIKKKKKFKSGHFQRVGWWRATKQFFFGIMEGYQSTLKAGNYKPH